MGSVLQAHDINPSEQIRQLGEIDKHVVRLLKSAGSAVETLAQDTTSSDSKSQDPIDLVESRTTFSAAASQYFESLRFIDIQLQEQISALEKAAILQPQDTTNTTQNDSASPSVLTRGKDIVNINLPKADGRKKAIIAGGLGSLDVGWLNSRNDNVSKELEADLWKEASRLVKDFEKQQSEDQKQDNQESNAQQEGDHEKMDES